MRVDQAFSDLIGRVYDCSLDQGLWPRALEDICGVLNGKFADLTVFDGVRGVMQVQASYGIPPELLESMLRHAHLNPAIPMGLVYPLGEPWCGSRQMGVEQFRKSLYWRSCMAGAGTLDVLAVAITRKVTQFGAWEVTGSEERGLFSDEDLDIARVITPHIRRAVEISGAIRHNAGVERTLQEMLEHVAAGAVIIARDGIIRFRNQAAEAELRDGSLVREVQGRLVGSHPEVGRLLAQLGEHPTRRQDGYDALVANEKGRQLHITWACLDRVADAVDAPFLILLKSPDADLRTPLGAAVDLFGLTGAEAQTLAQILEGRSMEEAGAVLGVARSTVKSHLDDIFAKSGTRRQTELVARVMGLVTAVK